MQLIAETYDVMRSALGMPAEDIASVFADWNTGELASYLIEVTADVLRYIDIGDRTAARRSGFSMRPSKKAPASG